MPLSDSEYLESERGYITFSGETEEKTAHGFE